MPTWFLEDYAAVLLDFQRFRWMGSLVGGLDGGAAPDTHRALWMRRHTHHHRFREVMVGLSGQGRYGCRGRVYPISPGTILLFDANEEHDSWYPTSGPPCCHLWLHEAPATESSSLFWNICEVRDHCFVRSPVTMPLALVRLPGVDQFWRGWDLLRSRRADAVARAQFFITFCTLIVDLYKHLANPPATRDAGAQGGRDVVVGIAQVIKHNLGGDLSLAHLSRLAGYNKFYFLRMFRKYQQCSLGAYIRQQKLRKAQELLGQGLKTAAVSDALGFANPSGFCRFFRQQTGKSPSAYLNPNFSPQGRRAHGGGAGTRG